MAPDEHLLDPHARDFLTHLKVDRAASQYTCRNYEQALTAFIQWRHTTASSPPVWGDLQRDDFRAYLRHLSREKNSRAAIHLKFSALRSFYKFLIGRGVLTHSPIKNISLPKLQKRLPMFMTKDQILKLVRAPIQALNATLEKDKKLDPIPFLRDAAILELLYSCGLRISELCGLKCEDIFWNEQVIRVEGKGKKERLAPVGAPALDSIQAYWKSLPFIPGRADYVFFSAEEKREPIYPRLIQLNLKKYLALAGLDPNLTPHKLRHTYATHMLDAGADLRSVQELLGHAHLVTTQVYTHITTERLKKAYDSAHPRA